MIDSALAKRLGPTAKNRAVNAMVAAKIIASGTPPTRSNSSATRYPNAVRATAPRYRMAWERTTAHRLYHGDVIHVGLVFNRATRPQRRVLHCSPIGVRRTGGF